VANKVLVVRDGKVDLFPGNYQDYEHIWRGRIEAREALKADISPSFRENGREGRGENIHGSKKSRDRKRMEAELRNRQYREKVDILSRMGEIEDEIDRTQRRIHEIHMLMGEKETYRDPETIKGLNKEFDTLKAKCNMLTEEWEEKAEALEQLEEAPVQSISSSSSSSRPK